MAEEGIRRKNTTSEKAPRGFGQPIERPIGHPTRSMGHHEQDHEMHKCWERPEQSDHDRLAITRRPSVLAGSNSDTRDSYRDGKRDGEATDRVKSLQTAHRRPASLPPEDRQCKSERPNSQGIQYRKPNPFYSAPSFPLEVETVYNSSDTKDVTIHLELDLMDDIDEEIENFNRLSRLGDFRGARLFFENHLNEHASNPFVFVLYAEMLLDQGDYKSILRLDEGSIFHLKNATNERCASPGLQKLSWNWKLIRATALSLGQFKYQTVWDEIKDITEVTLETPGSTDVRIMSLILQLRRLTTAHYPLSEQLNHADWSKIYQQLLAQDRIWDFRDIFIAFSRDFSTSKATEAFFKSEDPLEHIVADWRTTEPDESTELALLDIFTFMALGSNRWSEASSFAERCLEAADTVGEPLLRHFPAAIKSRSVQEWLVTKAAIAARKGPRSPLAFYYLSDYPGRDLVPITLGLPFYIPVRQENPGWHVPEPSVVSKQSVKLALAGAEEMDNYRMQVVCLEELILQSKKPTMLFDRLEHVQKSVQGDMDGYLTTCFSRYLICTDHDSKTRLLSDLTTFGNWDDPQDLLNPMKAATRDIMQRALSDAPQVGSVPDSIKAGVRYYAELPDFFQQMIDNHISRGAMDFGSQSRSIPPNREDRAAPRKKPSVPKLHIPSEQLLSQNSNGKMKEDLANPDRHDTKPTLPPERRYADELNEAPQPPSSPKDMDEYLHPLIVHLSDDEEELPHKKTEEPPIESVQIDEEHAGGSSTKVNTQGGGDLKPS